MGKRNENKMKASSIQSNECTPVDSYSFVENIVLLDTLSEGNQSSGLTQPMSNLTFVNSDPVFKFLFIQCCFILIVKTDCLKNCEKSQKQQN